MSQKKQTFKKMVNYRLLKNKTGVDLIPLDNYEVPQRIYDQYVEVPSKKG